MQNLILKKYDNIIIEFLNGFKKVSYNIPENETLPILKFMRYFIDAGYKNVSISINNKVIGKIREGLIFLPD